jgi:hypothetical protein
MTEKVAALEQQGFAVWFERLSVPRLLWALWLGRNKRLEVSAGSISAASSHLAGLARLAGLDLVLRQETVEFGLVDSQGYNLRYQVEKACAHLGNRLIEELGPLESALPAAYRNRVDEWCRILRAHFVAHASGPMVFLYNAVCRETQRPQGRDAVIYVSAQFLSRFMASNAPLPQGASLQIRSWPSLAELFAYAPLPGLIGFAILEILRAWRAGPAEIVVDPAALQKGTALEQYTDGILARYPEGGHLFWHQASGLASDRVVMLTNRTGMPLTEDRRKLFRKHRFGWVDGHNPCCFFPSPLRDGMSAFLGALALVPLSLRRIDWWRWLQVAHFAVILEAYRHLARRLNVIQLHQCDEQSGRALLLVLAVRMEGGMFFWNHWSVSHFPVAREGCGMADLLLAWGDYDKGLRTALGFDYSWVVKTGPLVARPLSQEFRQSAPLIRAKLSPGVTFAITLFDGSHGPGCHQPTWTLVDFLKDIFAGLQERPSWGLLLKPKDQRSLALLEEPEIVPLRQALQREGRLEVLDPLVQPTEAAQAADACVSYSINTAGLLAGLVVGKPSLHCDVAGMRGHFLYHSGCGGKILFPDVPAILSALEAIEKGAAGIGDTRSVAPLFNEFEDEFGNARAGKLIGDYIAGRDRGLKRDQALEHAVQNYAKTHGADFVASVAEARAGAASRAWSELLARQGFEIYPPAKHEALT